MAQQGEEGFGQLDDSIGNRCHLEETFDGWSGDGGGGKVIINATMAAAVEAATEKGWGGIRNAIVHTAVEYCKKGRSLLVTGGGDRIKPYHPFCLWAEYYT
jgi:hypothetical protein